MAGIVNTHQNVIAAIYTVTVGQFKIQFYDNKIVMYKQHNIPKREHFAISQYIPSPLTWLGSLPERRRNLSLQVFSAMAAKSSSKVPNRHPGGQAQAVRLLTRQSMAEPTLPPTDVFQEENKS